MEDLEFDFKEIDEKMYDGLKICIELSEKLKELKTTFDFNKEKFFTVKSSSYKIRYKDAMVEASNEAWPVLEVLKDHSRKIRHYIQGVCELADYNIRNIQERLKKPCAEDERLDLESLMTLIMNTKSLSLSVISVLDKKEDIYALEDFDLEGLVPNKGEE